MPIILHLFYYLFNGFINNFAAAVFLLSWVQGYLGVVV